MECKVGHGKLNMTLNALSLIVFPQIYGDAYYVKEVKAFYSKKQLHGNKRQLLTSSFVWFAGFVLACFHRQIVSFCLLYLFQKFFVYFSVYMIIFLYEMITNYLFTWIRWLKLENSKSIMIMSFKHVKNDSVFLASCFITTKHQTNYLSL